MSDVVVQGFRKNGEEHFIASVPILAGTRKAAGMGATREDALMNLVQWFAEAARDIDVSWTTSDGTASQPLQPEHQKEPIDR